MRRLMLLRHAKTEGNAPSGQDQDRRLDDRGRHDAAAIGDWIGRHPPFPDLVLVSPAVRALQTWEIAREAMKHHARQPQVGHQDVEREIGEPLNRLFTAVGLFDDEPMIGQALGDRFAQRRLIVNDQQMFLALSHLDRVGGILTPAGGGVNSGAIDTL